MIGNTECHNLVYGHERYQKSNIVHEIGNQHLSRLSFFRPVHMMPYPCDSGIEPVSFNSKWGYERTRSEEHTSELQSLMRISYAVFCLQKKNNEQSRAKSRRHITDTKHQLSNIYRIQTYKTYKE